MIKLDVDKKDWRIRYPLEGEIRIPAEPERHFETVELLPIGSKLFWSNDRLEKFIQDELFRSLAQIRTDQGRVGKRFDFTGAIREWATTYGFSAEEARRQIELWIAEVKENSVANEHRLGLAAFAENQFELAAQHFERAAAASIVELEQIDKEEDNLKLRRQQARHAVGKNYWALGLSLSQEEGSPCTGVAS